jgi:protein O-mannosyl-transferase
MAKKQPVQSSKAAAKPAPKPSTPAKDRTSYPWMMILIALVVTALCYLPNISDELVNWDDDPNITENVNLKGVGNGQPWGTTISNIFDLEKGNVIGNYNPLPILTFAIEKSLSGGEFGPKLNKMIHVNNLLLHLGVVFFAMRVLLLLGIGRWGALVGGLLMGIHPMRVESVLWATERKDVLFAIFFFASLECYIHYLKSTTSSRRSLMFVAAMVLGILSLFSKVQAVTLVGSWVLVDYLLRRPFSMQAVVDKVLLTGASVAIGMANLHTLKVTGSTDDTATGYNFLDRIAIGSWSFCTYLYKAIVPYPMSPIYPYPKPIPGWMYGTSIFFLTGLALLVWLYLSDKRIWAFALGFFICNVILLLQFFGAGQGYLADRFTYVPYFGLFFGAAWAFERYFNVNNTLPTVDGRGVVAAKGDSQSGMPSGAALAAAGIPLLIFAIWTVKQGAIWKNGETLWTHALQYQYDPVLKKYTNATPFWNRGQHRRKIAEAKRDLKLYEIALGDYKQAVATNSKDPNLHNSLGKTHFDIGMVCYARDIPKQREYVAKAIESYNNAISLSPGKVKNDVLSETHANRGSAYGALGNYPASLADLNKSIELKPDNKNAYFNRSIVYFNMQNYEGALGDYSTYLKYVPDDASILYERGMLYRSMKRSNEAIADLTKAIQINPKQALSYYERGRAYLDLGNTANGRADLQKYVQMGGKLRPEEQALLGQ